MKKWDIFGFLYRVELSPQAWSRGRWWRGNHETRRTAKHSISTRVNMDPNMYTLMSWAPRSEARDINGSVNIGTGGVGIALNYSISDLTIRALTNSGFSNFGARYSFSGNPAFVSATSFSRSSSSHLGGFLFEHHGDDSGCRTYACFVWMNTAQLSIEHEITYRSWVFGLHEIEALDGNWAPLSWWNPTLVSRRVYRDSF